MKIIIIAFLSFFAFTFTSHAQQYGWTQRSSLPAAQRYNPVGFSFQKSGYVGLGKGASGTLTDLWEFNTLTGAWTQRASYPGSGRYGAACFVIGEFAYVGCGWAPAPQINFYRYHITTNTWYPVASYPGTPFYTGVNFSIGGKGYTGIGFSPYTKEFYEYDTLTNAWTQKADFAGGIRQSTFSFAYNGKGYVTTGSHGWPANPYNDMWQYDPLTDSWTQKSSMPGAVRYGCSGFVIDSIAYVGLGQNGSGYFNDMFAYNINSDTWSLSDSFPGTQRVFPANFSIGSSGFLCAGGISGLNINFNDCWEYGPLSGFSSIASQETILAMPNICSEYFYIDLPEGFSNAAQLFLYDYRGNRVMASVLNKGKNKIIINPTIASGIYYGVCSDVYNHNCIFKIVIRKEGH